MFFHGEHLMGFPWLLHKERDMCTRRNWMCTNSEENKENKQVILAIVKLGCLEFLKPSPRSQFSCAGVCCHKWSVG